MKGFETAIDSGSFGYLTSKKECPAMKGFETSTSPWL